MRDLGHGQAPATGMLTAARCVESRLVGGYARVVAVWRLAPATGVWRVDRKRHSCRHESAGKREQQENSGGQSMHVAGSRQLPTETAESKIGYIPVEAQLGQFVARYTPLTGSVPHYFHNTKRPPSVKVITRLMTTNIRS